MSHLRCAKRFARTALTLLELVVVLGILAVLSTVAVRSLEPIADQARYELTQTVLKDLRLAVVGDPKHFSSNDSAISSSFITDTGALPADVSALLTKPIALSTQAIQSFDSNRDAVNDVTLTSGWNGPYLQLGPGTTEVLDGWGREPTLVESSGDLDIVSLGSDGDSIASEDGYRADFSVSILTRDYTGDIVFRLYAIDALNGSRIDPNPTGTEQLAVLFYGVNAAGGSTGAVAEQTLVVANAGSFEFRRANTTCGRVAARAILWDDTDSDDQLDVGESILKKSFVHYPVVLPAADVRIEMELR